MPASSLEDELSVLRCLQDFFFNSILSNIKFNVLSANFWISPSVDLCSEVKIQCENYQLLLILTRFPFIFAAISYF